METATQPTTKRLRTDPSVLSSSDKETPMSAATKTLTSLCSSLQPEISNLLSKLGREHLLLLQRLNHKKTQITKLEADPNFIPRSARVQFQLTSNKLAESDAGFIRLVDETLDLVSNFQSALKEKIIATAKIETNIYLDKLRQDFATNIRVTTQALALCEPNTTPIDKDRVVVTILDRYAPSFLEQLDMSKPDFLALYQRTHALPALPTPLAIPTIRDVRQQAVTQPQSDAGIPYIYRAIESAFMTPWKTYQATQKRLEISLELKKLYDEHTKTNTTDATAMLLDAEMPADPPQLRALIDSIVNQKTKTLQHDLQQLKTRADNSSTKNTKRGQGKGATTKKSSPVDENNNASKRDNKNSSKPTSTKKSKKPSTKKPKGSTSKNNKSKKQQKKK